MNIHFKILALTYKLLQTNQTIYLHNLLNIQPASTTCSFSVITMLYTSDPYRVHEYDCSFSYYSAIYWNSLPKQFRWQAAVHSAAILISSVLVLALSSCVNFILSSRLSSLLTPLLYSLLYLWKYFLVFDMALNFHIIHFTSFVSFIFHW